MRPKINIEGEERKIKIEKEDIKAETVKDKNKNKPNRKKAFLKGVKEGEEEEEEMLLNWDAVPIAYIPNRDELLAVYREPAVITNYATIRTGKFVFYTVKGEHYARAELELEDIAYLIKRLEAGVNFIEARYEISDDIEIYKRREGDITLSIFITKDRKIAFFIRNDDLWAKASINVIQAVYLIKVLDIEFSNAYLEAHSLRIDIREEIQKGVTQDLKKKYNWDGMMYG